MTAWKLAFVASFVCASAFCADNSEAAWSGKSAAAYLDGRENWWMTWANAKRDHDTFCVSCHTALPYALGRPALRGVLGETAPSATEKAFLDNVIKRVRMWKEVEPFYPDKERGVPKTAESRGTEAVLNALILANYDRAAGKQSDDGRLALANMWGLQETEGPAKGAFAWLQFHNAPWEGDSQFWGATLAALAAGIAPDYLATADPDIHTKMNALREYLARERDSQALMYRIVLVWASGKLPGLLPAGQRKSIIDEAVAKQQADGGWSLSALAGDWKRHDNTPLETKSDGYATGLVTLAMEQAGVGRDNAALSRGLAWLTHHQESEGRWLAYSLNKQRDLSTDVGKFMSDAATAYAVMALTGAK